MAGNPKFTVLFEKLRGKVFEINRDTMSIGRKDGMDIAIKDASLSSHHADIIRSERDGKVVYTLRDNDSTNGTKINNIPVQGEQVLHNSDLILFGAVEVLFDGADDSEPGDEFTQTTHTIDLSSIDSKMTGNLSTMNNLNPFAREEAQKRAKQRIIMIAGAIALGVLVIGLTGWVIFGLLFPAKG